VGDRRLWDAQWEPFAQRHRVVRYDARGFGDSPLPDGPFSRADDLRALLDHLHIERAAVVGNSMGAMTALDFALAHHRRAAALVLVGPAPMGPPSKALEAFNAREDALLDEGRIDEAAELNVKIWLAPDADPGVRKHVAAMQRRAFEVQVAAYAREPGPRPSSRLEPPAADRLGEVAAPTLVVVGDSDLEDVHAAADRLVGGIPGARKETIAGAAHLPGLERPEAFNRIVLAFLAGFGQS
jgi:pimeloyl-ACP methyl ester carboxylesterase